MDIETILSPDAIAIGSKFASKKRLFKELSEVAKKVYGLDADKLQCALQAREDLGPTGMGVGTAIPHARVEGLEHVCGVFMKLEEPMEFDAVDGKPIDLVFALFAPEHSGTEHLKALARVSRVLREPSVRDNLRAADDAQSIYTILINSVDLVAA